MVFEWKCHKYTLHNYEYDGFQVKNYNLSYKNKYFKIFLININEVFTVFPSLSVFWLQFPVDNLQ